MRELTATPDTQTTPAAAAPALDAVEIFRDTAHGSKIVSITRSEWATGFKER
jgi:hypothetical protein